MKNIYIPEKIKIGFVNREDTFSGKLGFIIPYETNGKLRQEHAFECWRDKKLGILDIENKPQENFILNKDIQRYTDFGRTAPKVRVYDQRGYEFEIGLTNMLYILMHSDVSKRDIHQQCVFGWSGKELVLVPINSEAYQQANEYKKIKNAKVSAKEFKDGCFYKSKKFGDVIYMGYYDCISNHDYWVKGNRKKFQSNIGKKHLFFSSEAGYQMLNTNDLIEKINDTPSPNYAYLVDNLLHKTFIKKTGKFKLTQLIDDNYYTLSGQHLIKLNIIPLYGKFALKLENYCVDEDDNSPKIVFANEIHNLNWLGERFNPLINLFKKSQTANKNEIISALKKCKVGNLSYFNASGKEISFKIIK